MLDDKRGIQRPLPPGQTVERSSERRLFEDGQFYRPNGRALFVFDEPQPVADPTTAAFPFTLLTGRASSAHWHTQTRTGKSAVLRKLGHQHAYCEINPQDAGRLGIRAGEAIKVLSPRGEAEVQAMVTPTIRQGQLFIPMHYEVANRLTFSSFDPHSRQPSYKSCAVRVEKLIAS
jgi:assimilatory nitrate reductase catalytic subunit